MVSVLVRATERTNLQFLENSQIATTLNFVQIMGEICYFIKLCMKWSPFAHLKQK